MNLRERRNWEKSTSIRMKTLMNKRKPFPPFQMKILILLVSVVEVIEDLDEVIEGIEVFAPDSEAIEMVSPILLAEDAVAEAIMQLAVLPMEIIQINQPSRMPIKIDHPQLASTVDKKDTSCTSVRRGIEMGIQIPREMKDPVTKIGEEIIKL